MKKTFCCAEMRRVSCSRLALLFCIISGSLLSFGTSQTTTTTSVANSGFWNGLFNHRARTNVNFRNSENFSQNVPLNQVRSSRGRRNRRIRMPRWKRKLYTHLPISMNGLFGDGGYGYNQQYSGPSNGLYGQLFQQGRYPAYNQLRSMTPDVQPQSSSKASLPPYYRDQPHRNSYSQAPLNDRNQQSAQSSYGEQQQESVTDPNAFYYRQPSPTYFNTQSPRRRQFADTTSAYDLQDERSRESRIETPAEQRTFGQSPNTELAGSSGDGEERDRLRTRPQAVTARQQQSSSFWTFLVPSYFRNRPSTTPSESMNQP